MPTKKNNYTDAVPPGKKRPRKGSQPKLYGEPKNYPQSNKFIGERKKAIDAGKKTFNVNGKTFPVTGGGPKMVGSKEKYTEGNFPEAHHMKMMGSPLYYGESKPAFMGGNYRATDTNKEVFSGNKEEKKEEGSKKSEGSKRLSAARSRRKEARRNLKADRLNRRADRMEARRK